jgi:predicted O-methyltransferase YrrM
MKRHYELPPLTLECLTSSSGTPESPILDDICLPPHVASEHDDVGPLLAIARQFQPAVVVELGTAHGNTVANLCRVCPYAKVYTVNALSEEQTGAYVTHVLDRAEIGRVYRRHGFADRVVQIYGNTLHVDLGRHLASDSVDLAIIDACHDTKYVINDFHKTAPFVRAGGVILLHDTHPSMRAHLGGSYIACMKLRRQGFDIRHLTGTWWAVWIKPEGVDGPNRQKSRESEKARAISDETPQL